LDAARISCIHQSCLTDVISGRPAQGSVAPRKPSSGLGRQAFDVPGQGIAKFSPTLEAPDGEENFCRVIFDKMQGRAAPIHS
jgi:hypothetical protein